MANTYNVFISHSWAHVDDLKNLRTLLKNRGYFSVEFEETSPYEPIDSENAEYIKKRLREKVRNAGIVLGIAGVYASHSDWIEWELDTALKHGIPIVGVIPRGQKRISQVVDLRSKENVRWNTESIVAVIRKWAI